MNSRERIKAAFDHKQPDRVPVWCLLSLEHIIRNGMPGNAIPVRIEELVPAECALVRRYNFDGTLVYLPGSRAGADIEGYIRRSISEVPTGDASHVFEEADPDSWARDIPDYLPEDFFSSHLTREIMGPGFHVGGWVADGFSRAIQWFPSLEDAMMATVLDPARFLALVRYFDELSVAWAVAQVQLGGLESLQISSPYAGAGFISLDAYKQFVLPSVRQVAEAIQPLEAYTYLHTCGFISDRLELLEQTGVDGIECMDPPPLGDVTLAEAKERVGGRIALKGNLDSVNVLLGGSDEQVDRTIRETIAAGKPGGGYILSSACSIAPDVPPERVARLAQLAEETGGY